MRLIDRVCVPCLLTGSVLFVFAGSALASDGAATMIWRDLATGAVGLVVLMVGAYSKGQQRKIDRVDEDLRTLRETVIAHHPNRDGVREAIAAGNATIDLRLCSVENALRAVHRRLDYLRVPPNHSMPPDDDT